MQREEYISLIRQRLKVNKFSIEDGGNVENYPLILSASKSDSVFWLIGRSRQYFFVTEFESLDFNTLKQFASACSHFAHDSFKLRGVFPPLVLSYCVAITNQLDSDVANRLLKTKPPTRWGTFVLEYPIAVIPDTGEIYYPPHRINKHGHFHTLDGTAYYDQTPDYIDIMLSPTNTEIRLCPP